MEMINVKIDEVNGVLVTTSNRVAEELRINHYDLLEKIDLYISKFNSPELSGQFYIPYFYKAKNGRKVRNYLITKKGIAQLIGGYSSAVEKAFDLNVAYINKFEEMEKALKGVPLKTPSSQQKKIKFEPVKFYKSNGNDVVNAHELWYFLQIKTTFLTWIKRRIEKFDFIEDEDFVVSGDKYLLMLDMAKELCTIENTSSSRLLRKYIRAFEKKEKEKLETSKKNKKLGYILTNNIALRTYAEKLLGIISGIDIGKPINSIDWWAIKHNCQQIKAYAYPIEVDKKYGVEQQGLITFEY